jgi:hypothetical protein
MKSKMQSVLLLTAAILVVVTNVAEAAVQTPAYVRCGGDDGETPILEKLSVHGSRFSIDGIDFLINDGFSLRMGSDGEHVILSKDSTDVILGKIRLPRLDCKKSNAWKPRLETVSIDLDPGALAVKSEIPFGSCSTDNQYRTYRKTIIVGAVRNPAAGAAFTQQSRRYYSTEAACEKEAPPPNWIDLISNVGGAVFKFLNRATSSWSRSSLCRT